MVHLFEGTQEQSYVARMMAFAACIGQYQDRDHCNQKSAANNNYPLFYLILLLLFISIRDY
jgi:hypothetical protein